MSQSKEQLTNREAAAALQAKIQEFRATTMAEVGAFTPIPKSCYGGMLPPQSPCKRLKLAFKVVFVRLSEFLKRNPD